MQHGFIKVGAAVPLVSVAAPCLTSGSLAPSLFLFFLQPRGLVSLYKPFLKSAASQDVSEFI